MHWLQYNIGGVDVNDETVGNLRKRLNVMREIVQVLRRSEVCAFYIPRTAKVILFLLIILAQET